MTTMTMNWGRQILISCCVAAGCTTDTANDADVDGTSEASGGPAGTVGSTSGSDSSTGQGNTTSSTGIGEGTESGEAPTTTGGPNPGATPLHTIIYMAGPAWDPSLAPREQDLAAHFTYVQGLFESGILLANGPFLDDGRGFYLHVAENVDDLEAIISDDPAVESGVLALDERGSWTLLLSQLDIDVGDDVFFVLDYEPGPSWTRGVSLARQPGIDEHLGYVGGAFRAGDLLAGGPVDEASGRYIVALPDAPAATAWVDADPTVHSGLFEVEIKPWLPLLRQAVADAVGE